MGSVSILTALFGGILSFLSPCVLPLIPAYISYISGVSLQDINEGDANTSKIFANSVAFVIGFSIVFILLGASASAVGRILSRNKRTFDLIAGIIIALFGLHTSGLVRFKFLNYEKKANVKSRTPSFLNALLLGIAFSFGWTPCVGPILGAILTQASTLDTMGKGVALLAIYSLGLGIPFVLTAIAINKFFVAFRVIRKYFNQIEIFTGLLLIGVGFTYIFRTGIHAWSLVSIILLSLCYAVLAGEKIKLFGSISLFLISVSEVLFLNGVSLSLVVFETILFNLIGALIVYKEGITK
ncbi:MAG: cytochrome c biogenesis CcdA family protein [Caldisericaceae bacterium]